MNRKILVAVDKSNYYRHILHYLKQLFLQQHDVHFRLMSIVPCHVGAVGREWLDQSELMSVIDAPTRKNLKDCTVHMQQVKKNFIDQGFQEERIETEVRLARAGIATDLIHDAQKNLYDALIIGKRDLSLVEKMIAGSTSTEILERNNGLPVWVVNGKIDSHKFLVPVDCSPHTLDAVDHMAFVLQDNPFAEITLFHSCSLLASDVITPKEKCYDKWGKEWCDEHLKGEEGGHYHFCAPERILKDGGFPMDRVRRLETHTGIEPGQQIVQHIKNDGYGTIVMGRRRKDVSKGIFKGVSDRVLANVTDVAVWMLG